MGDVDIEFVEKGYRKKMLILLRKGFEVKTDSLDKHNGIQSIYNKYIYSFFFAGGGDERIFSILSYQPWELTSTHMISQVVHPSSVERVYLISFLSTVDGVGGMSLFIFISVPDKGKEKERDYGAYRAPGILRLFSFSLCSSLPLPTKEKKKKAQNTGGTVGTVVSLPSN
jgi:hypothetical protein